MHKEQKNFKRFLFFHFGHLSIQSVASSISFGMIYSILQKIPFRWYITCGLLVHGYRFRKTCHSLQGLKGYYKAALANNSFNVTGLYYLTFCLGMVMS